MSADTDIDQTFEALFRGLYDISDNFDIMICGDLNALMGSLNGTIDIVTDPLRTGSGCIQERKSRDSNKINQYENQLIERCFFPWLG